MVASASGALVGTTTGSGLLAAAMAATAALSATVGSAGSLTWVAAAVATLSGPLAASGSIAMSAAAATSTTATVSADGALAAPLTTSASLSANLTQEVAEAMAVSMSASAALASATLTADGTLVAGFSSSTDLTALMSALGIDDLEAAMAAAATLSASLSDKVIRQLVVETKRTFMKQRIHDALNSAVSNGEFYKCKVDHRTGAMSIDPDKTISPTSIVIKETRSSFRSAGNYRRQSGAGELSSWTWIARVSFAEEVACEVFEDAAIAVGIKVPATIGIDNQRTLLARLADSDYSHAPEQSPSRGTVVDFIFEVVPETLRK